MMRINSVDSFSSDDKKLVFVATALPKEGGLPLRIDGAQVVFDLTEVERLAGQKSRRLVLVENSVSESLKCIEVWGENSPIEYWARVSHLDGLRELLASEAPVAVGGLIRNQDWIRVRFEVPQKDARPGHDLLTGLTLAAPSIQVAPSLDAPIAAGTSLRALLIARLAAVAKPLKQYLPSSIVVSLYKLLEKIR